MGKQKYLAVDDALTLMGIVISDSTEELGPEGILELLTTETEEDVLQLLVTLAAMAAGFAAVITGGDGDELMRMMALTRDSLDLGEDD